MRGFGITFFLFLIFIAFVTPLRADHVSHHGDPNGLSRGLSEIHLLDEVPCGLPTDTVPESLIGTKFIAISLNIALGLFGLHRVFLGTDVIVPIFYTFTFGGGGILWLADLVMLICKKEYSQFTDNPRLVMFSGRKNEAASPHH